MMLLLEVEPCAERCFTMPRKRLGSGLFSCLGNAASLFGRCRYITSFSVGCLPLFFVGLHDVYDGFLDVLL